MKTAAKRRLDQLMVDRGLAESREKAQALILAGAVRVAGQAAGKPGHSTPEDAAIELTARLPYVSRGGLKLAAALDHFGIDVAGKVCLDVGSSTGGFTDCLLQRGAVRVHALDTGTGQLAWKLRQDPRVRLREGFNARYLTPADIGEAVDFACCDASFISATMLIPPMAAALKEGGELVILVKPQFEANRGDIGKGGIVRDPAVHRAACDRVRACVEQLGFRVDIIESPILGAEGNREFLLHGCH